MEKQVGSGECNLAPLSVTTVKLLLRAPAPHPTPRPPVLPLSAAPPPPPQRVSLIFDKLRPPSARVDRIYLIVFAHSMQTDRHIASIYIVRQAESDAEGMAVIPFRTPSLAVDMETAFFVVLGGKDS